MRTRGIAEQPLILKKRTLSVVAIAAIAVASIGSIFYITAELGIRDTFFTTCHVTGQGSLVLKVISDSTGTPVSGETVMGVLRSQATCDEHTETQVVHFTNFTRVGGGWLSPRLPNGAQWFGTFSMTVGYDGKTYSISADIHPATLTCILLRVPSGSVNTTFSYLSSDCATH
jgi:hypothetical protein